jgi:hypothetical protein
MDSRSTDATCDPYKTSPCTRSRRKEEEMNKSSS